MEYAEGGSLYNCEYINMHLSIKGALSWTVFRVILVQNYLEVNLKTVSVVY